MGRHRKAAFRLLTMPFERTGKQKYDTFRPTVPWNIQSALGRLGSAPRETHAQDAKRTTKELIDISELLFRLGVSS